MLRRENEIPLQLTQGHAPIAFQYLGQYTNQYIDMEFQDMEHGEETLLDS